ncbi:hypothetical protein N657DRAFT_701176 [Parathielavia appendiculata]|uniref:Uncharacterized protein n=1 Tax=Parathielavia appendiculata TaxID=2587402 RepID=A0AAN6TTS2_9PEZI|nr:hypothetical protein N657DRAFT_701176 [Parathielavia appendiculata]
MRSQGSRQSSALFEDRRWILRQRGWDLAVLGLAKLLWELPIALHLAGATMAELGVNNLPQFSSFSMLYAKTKTERRCGGYWVRHARNLKYWRSDSQAPEDSGPAISKTPTKLTSTITDEGERSGAYPVDPIITRIRRLCFAYLGLQQKTLDMFCKKLGNRLESLGLYDVKLHDGRWANADDILRTKLAPGPAVARHSLAGLQWGDFAAAQSEASSPLEEGNHQSAVRSTEPLEWQIERYIAGELEHNPMRD